MIKIENSQVKDLLPFSNLRIKALSYALNKQIQKLKLWSDTSKVRALVDKLQEPGLDILAKELNTPFYDDNFNIDKKRLLIKNTFIYYQYLGSRYGIKLLLNDVFGGGDVYKEWYEYDGEPYHFYISVASQFYSEEAKKEFLRKLKIYSRLSVWCDGIISASELPQSIAKIYGYVRSSKIVEVKNYV